MEGGLPECAGRCAPTLLQISSPLRALPVSEACAAGPSTSSWRPANGHTKPRVGSPPVPKFPVGCWGRAFQRSLSCSLGGSRLGGGRGGDWVGSGGPCSP